jgi:hypothetical protein
MKKGRCPVKGCGGKIKYEWKGFWLHINCSAKEEHSRRATVDEWSYFVAGII